MRACKTRAIFVKSATISFAKGRVPLFQKAAFFLRSTPLDRRIFGVASPGDARATGFRADGVGQGVREMSELRPNVPKGTFQRKSPREHAIPG